jgi:hypothetical protein
MEQTDIAPGNRLRLQRMVSTYKSFATILLNTVLTVALFNLALHILFLVRGPEPGTATPANTSSRLPEGALKQAYPDFTKGERDKMLDENWLRRFEYEDYVLFKERAYKGQYVNVSPAGFRHNKNQGPWPPQASNLNVFVFGGSTTFSYGLPDYQTLPSLLQEAAAAKLARNVAVYNFGVGWYHSTQERITLERLLTKGFKPDVAIFVDGLNDCSRINDLPPFRDQFRQVFDVGNGERFFQSLLHQTPTGRLIRGFGRRLQRPTGDDRQQQAQEIVDRYQTNKRLIDGMCKEFEITPIFVWQPVPGYKFDLRRHPFVRPEHLPIFQQEEFAYTKLAGIAATNDLGSNFLWCADLQENDPQLPYVDAHHYTASFAKKLANFIVDTAVARGLLDRFKASPR